jgi:TonB family protein
METLTASAPDVYSARDIARAAGVSAREVRRLFDSGEIPGFHGRYARQADAAAAVSRLRRDAAAQPFASDELFRPHVAPRRSSGRALAASGSLHATVLAAVALLTTWNVATREAETPRLPPARLVFLAVPGPGGGGGGGGLRQPAPPPRAELKGASRLRSPVPPPRRLAARRPEPVKRVPPPPPRPTPAAKPVEPPPAPPQPEQLPQVVAPVATAPADAADRAGVLADTTAKAPSSGPGSGGGVGTGQGTGIGEGDGSGIGPGSGGGTGGGPYRPGSGITPPAILREVKPDYTEEARRRGVEGDVVLEIVVRSDGTVGTVTLLQGLGAGLDQRAVDAVRQWRFSPARRHGTPVDVVVEVAVEFKLR